MLYNEGFIGRIRRWLYQFPGNCQITKEELLCDLPEQGIICVKFALFYYGYSKFTPGVWSAAAPRTASQAVGKIEKFPIRAYCIQKEYFQKGIYYGNTHRQKSFAVFG